jgi:hypothetical protein
MSVDAQIISRGPEEILNSSSEIPARDFSGIEVAIPSIDDLILIKQVASRPKDLEDTHLLRILKGMES